MSAPAAVLTEVWAWRQLLANLVRKELKVRYKGSALGILWSLISPLMMAVVFTVVFKTFLRIPFGNGDFTVFFLAGYLMWQFFQNSVMASSGSIIGNGQLISKVYFPRELLPLSLVISQGVHLLIAYVATAPLFIYYRGFHPELLPLLAVALVLLAVFTAGVSMYFGALTIKYRDLTEFLPDPHPGLVLPDADHLRVGDHPRIVRSRRGHRAVHPHQSDDLVCRAVPHTVVRHRTTGRSG